MGKSNKSAPIDDYSIGTALKYGNVFTILSGPIMGLGNIYHKQFIKGLLFFMVEVMYIIYMMKWGVTSIVNFITLGVKEQAKDYIEATGIYETIPGDNSMLSLLYGVITMIVTVGFIIMLIASIKSAYYAQYRKALGKHTIKFKEDFMSLFDRNIHILFLTPPVLGIVAFTVVPIIFMIFIAFTNYDIDHLPPGNLFDWVGLDNFKELFNWSKGGKIGITFRNTLIWTLVWAFFATFTNYFLGMILALVINRKGTRCKSFWRFMFALSISIPVFVSLLTMRTMFNVYGPVNIILQDLGLIEEPINFFMNTNIARVLIILINIWIGVPFTMLNHTGILQNIPNDLYEAADVEGANTFVKFFKITLPYMLFVTGPVLITQFISNINNFNVIYLLSGGGPGNLDYYYAGETDLLVTWLYKLTMTERDYKMGSVIGIAIFVISAVSSILVYRNMKSYKDEEGFQ